MLRLVPHHFSTAALVQGVVFSFVTLDSNSQIIFQLIDQYRKLVSSTEAYKRKLLRLSIPSDDILDAFREFLLHPGFLIPVFTRYPIRMIKDDEAISFLNGQISSAVSDYIFLTIRN